MRDPHRLQSERALFRRPIRRRRDEVRVIPQRDPQSGHVGLQVVFRQQVAAQDRAPAAVSEVVPETFDRPAGPAAARFVQQLPEVVPHADRATAGTRGFPEEGFEPFRVGHAVHEKFRPNTGSLEDRDVPLPPGRLDGARGLCLQQVLHPTQDVEVVPMGSHEHDLLSAADATQREQGRSFHVVIGSVPEARRVGGGECDVGGLGRVRDKLLPRPPSSPSALRALVERQPLALRGPPLWLWRRGRGRIPTARRLDRHPSPRPTIGCAGMKRSHARDIVRNQAQAMPTDCNHQLCNGCIMALPFFR